MQTFKATPFLDIRCGLSESPYWEEDKNVLRFVDIVKKNVYRVNLNDSEPAPQKHEYNDTICVTADLDSSKDHFIFGGKYGVGIGDKDTASAKILRPYWSPEEDKDGKPGRMRANDGAVDSKGRFWVNTLCDPEVVENQTADG